MVPVRVSCIMMVVAPWTRDEPTSESVELGVGVGEVAHLPPHCLALLRHLGETRRWGVEPAGAKANQLEPHRPQDLPAVIELFLGFLLLAGEISNRAPLTAQHGEPADALFAGAIIQRIRLRLQSIDLLLHAFGGLLPGAAVHIGQGQRKLLHLAENLVGGGTNFRNLLPVIRRHVEQLAMYLAMIALGFANGGTVPRVGERRRCARWNGTQTRRRTPNS